MILKVILIIVAFYALCVLVLPLLVLHFLCDRHIKYKTVYTPQEFGLPQPEEFYLTTCDGLEIWSALLVPRQVKGVIVIVSGIDGPSVTSFYGYAREFMKLGLAVYMPELRAHGPSQGDRICLAYKETADLQAVCDNASARFPGLPLILLGLSMGAATVLRTTGSDKRVCAAVSMSGYSSIQDFIYAQARRYTGPVFAYPLYFIAKLYCGWKYGVDAEEATPINGIRKLDGRPLLMVHSRKDYIVPYYCFQRNLEAAHKASTKVTDITIPGHNHFIISNYRHPEQDRTFFPTLLSFLQSNIV